MSSGKMEKKTMPPLWKKAKNTSVSAFISDIRSRRRRSSLVVQTGFPTSVADLVVKNRSRLKKPSSKKKTSAVDCPPTPSPSLPPSSQFSSSPEASVLELPLSDRSESECGGESIQSELSKSGSEDFSCLGSEEINDAGVSGSRCFSAILMVFLVVILALVTKEIAVGITASAFILFFLEFLQRRLSFCQRECAGGSDAIRIDESNSGSFDRKRRMEFSQENGNSVDIEKVPNGKACQSNEPQVTESNLDLLMCGKGLECKGEVLGVGDNGDLIKVRRNRNRKLSNAISMDNFAKKLVPKKFRAPKTGKVCKEEEKLDSSSEASEFKGGKGEEEFVQVPEECQEMEDEEVCPSEFSVETSSMANSVECKGEVLEVGDNEDLIKIKRNRNRKLSSAISMDKFLKKLVPKKYRAPKTNKSRKEEEKLDSSSEASELKGGEGGEEFVQVQEECQEMEDEEVCTSEFSGETSSLANSEDAVTRENMCAEAKKSDMGHLIIFAIVLFGLVGGRAMALLLTVAWYLLGKAVETGWRKLKKIYESRELL